MATEPKRALLYIHIPFCVRRCRYCAACMLTGDSAAKRAYLDALEREIQAALPSLGEYRFPALYVGGGSPSVMRPDDLAKLLRSLKSFLNLERGAELNIEIMPQTTGTPSLTGLKQGGFNRLSLSVQSIVPAELETLECGFSVQDIQNAVLFLRRFRFNNVNLDLMYGIPGQTARTLARTLNAVLAFAQPHVSLYPFPALDCTDQAQALYQQAASFLREAGYAQYTSFHFARGRRESKYFRLRYQGMDFIGLGLGARSLIQGISYANASDLQRYLTHAGDFEHLVTDVVALTSSQRHEYLTTSQAYLAR